MDLRAALDLLHALVEGALSLAECLELGRYALERLCAVGDLR
jgi:hypothetical protein